MKTPISGAGAQQDNSSAAAEVEKKKSVNSELWQACAGPLASLPAAGTHVVYFPQGHSEQVAASMKKGVDAQIPNYPNLPSKLLCLLHSVTLLADLETDEVYAQMTLQPVPSFDKDALLKSDLSMKAHKPQTEFFCKTLTASDTSTHGGFSVPRRAAEKIFPPLDFTMQPPAQELVARDLHDNLWTFRHIFRGQPKRHLLTTGWSLFVSGKRLFAGDSVLFIRDEKQQLLLGIRRAHRQQTNLSSSVLSSDSMQIGILAAAAHAAANNSPFTVFYNPRASPSEFVIPLAKYYKATCGNQISLGMRFRMMFETEESGTRRYMGTITGISDLDPVRWKNSQWCNLQVGWDESTTGERRNRVSIWEVEPVTAPFFICPTQPFFRSKRPRQPGMPDDDPSDPDNILRRTMPWIGDDFGIKDPQALPGFSLVQWMNMQQNPSLANPMQPNYMSPLSGSVMQNLAGTDISRQLGLSAMQMPTQQSNIQFNTQMPPQQNNLQFNSQRSTQQAQQLDQLQKLPMSMTNPLGSVVQTQQHMADISQSRQNLNGQSQTLPNSQAPSQILPSQSFIQNQSVFQQPQSLMDHQQLQRNHSQQQNLMRADQTGPQSHVLENHIQMQLFQKLQQQQQSLLAQQSPNTITQLTQLHDHQKQQLLEIPPSFSRPMATTQTLDASHSHVLSQQMSQQMTRNYSQNHLLRYPQPPHQHHVGPTVNHPINNNNQLPAVNNDVPSCSTSPSTDNCSNGANIQSAVPLLNTGSLETSAMPNPSGDLVSDLHLKPSMNVSRSQNQGLLASQAYLYNNANGTHIDYLDSSSSATSVLSQNDVHIHPPSNNNSMSFNSQSMQFRNASHDGEVQGDPRASIPFGESNNNMDVSPLEMTESVTARNVVGTVKDLPADLSSEGGAVLPGYENHNEAQGEELSSSMISQSFGVPDMAFNSIDSTINNEDFMTRGAWAPPQLPRMRTFTKVYKRGAVGRSIDIARYSGYDELKQDLARRFGIEGQLEDRQRVGWKLVYVDNENDVLLVGDDPWEEFVSCVRCIKILSPQEVQQLSLDGDLGNSVLPNQACSSSDNGVN